MKIAFNPSTVAALITPPNNKDITFDLRGRNIFARGVKFCGTDTWRDIKINNVSIGSNILDLRNGSNTTLTNTNGVVTINSTWRPVVDNLTSDSTTSSLSAKQGKILKSLIDGKSNSGHTHDDRYLKLTGGTMAGNALITFADSGSWGTDKGPQGARGGLYWTGQSDYAKLYAEETVGDNLDLVIQFGDDNSNGLSIRNKANTQTSYISASGVITTGTFKGNLDWSYITNKPSSYTPSAHTHAWNSLTHSSTTENQAILTNGKANGWKLYTLNISRWDNAANNAHSHANKSVLDGITSALVNNWNIAYNFVHTITETDTDKVINKWDEIVNFLAGITEDNKLNTLLNNKLSVYKLADNTNVGAIKNNGIYYSTTDASSGTLTNSPFNTGFALINMTSYDGGDDLRRSRLAFNAYGEIKVSNDRDQANTAETWYNVLTSKNSGISGSTIKLNGTSITVYSSSTADGRYVKKSGDTMSGTLTIDTTNFGALTIKRNDDANGASIQFRGKSSVYGYIGLNNSTKDKQFLRWNSDTSKTYTILDTSSTYTSNGKGVINGTTITQVDNATNSTNSTNARKLVNWYSSRPTSLNTQFGDGSLRIFYATSSTTEGKPAEDSHILHLAWDNNGGWDAQLAVHTRSGKVSTRAQNSGTWQPWKTLAFTTDIPSSLKNPYSLNVFGVTYDGSAAKVVSPSNFISQVNEATSTVTDGTMLITSYASNSGFADTNAVNIPYKRKAIHLWEYIKAKTDSLYTTKSHNHDDRYVRAFGTSNDNIDSDWGQSFKTFDPIPSGTPPEQNPNISILNIGNNFNRRKQLAFIYSNDNIYYRRHVDNSFTNWRRIAFANEIPTSLKNPYALTISLNGTSQGPYDGSAAKNINITPGSIGAAVSNHSHDYLVVNAADNKSFNSAYHNFQVLYAGGGNGITGKPTNVDAFGLFKFRVASGWSGQMLLANGGSLYIRSSEDAKITNTLAWKTILDSSNYSGILDSRYYTESEVNSLLDAKLNRQNLSYGTWNPRGYNLAADYYYNGGDLSISESGGKIHISVDGYFWQNEGQYRVLDTSDISSIRGGLTLYQHLSATDTTRYPLVWGGSDHKNTNNSTGSLYKSYDKLSWQTSSQTLYATNIQTENIKHLSIGGGIYWNPYVESTTDGSDSASITVVKSGVAGGTTLVLSQMNDANDTIQFQTNGSARLYHNSYPILTTQNTYVSNNKGYINGTEITQVNNADTLDSWHKDNIQWTGYITSADTLASYWFKMYDITVTKYPYNDITITFLVSEGYSSHFSIFYLRIRQNGAIDSGNYGLGISLYELVGNLRDKVVAYYNNSTGNVQLWGNTGGRWGTMNYTILKKTTRTATDSSSLGILTAQSFSSVQTLPSTGYTKVTMSRVGSVSYSDSTGSVHWNNVTNKPSTFTPAAHTHTVFKNNLMIKGTNGISDSASIHLGIGDSDTGFKWISDGKCQIYANNSAVGEWTSGGMNWFKNPTVNGNKIWNAGNDGSGSGLDADKIDGYHASSLWRSDGATWNPNANVSLNASANSQEWSFDIRRNGYTGCYWHVWDSSLDTMLKVNADNGKVYAPYNFVGSLEGNASTTSKLQTPRTIWGQSFNGTANVDNTLRIRQTTGNYCEGIRIQTADSTWATIILGATGDSGTNANAWSIHRKSDNNFAISRNSSDGTNGLVMTSVGMGLGTTAPTQRLDVAGNIRTTGNLYISHVTNNNMNYNTSNPRIVFSESGSQAVGLVYTDYNSYRASKGLKVMDVDNDDTGNVWFEVQGYNYSSGYVKNGSSDSYVLLGGGGHKAVSAFAPSSHSHNYAANENYGGFTKSGRLPISGFYQSNASESGGNAPWSGWMHLINCQHSNTGNNYALQIAASFSNNNTFKIRVTNNNVNNAWRDIIHSGNIGSQSVAYASKAGSVAWDSITGKPSSFTPSAHTHSWTSITDKLVAGNEFNIVNAGFNNRMWFNYVPINDRSKTATILDYGFGNGHQGYATVTASGFVKNGSSSSYVLLGDGGHKTISSLSVNYANSAGNADTVDGYHATSGRTFNGNINWASNWNDTWSDGTHTHPWYGFDHRYPNTGAYSTTISDYFGMTIKTANTLRLDFGTLLLNGTSIYSINVASATKLQTPRSIWGHSFNGTADVNGTIYINNNNSSEGAIRLNNNINSNARISAIDSQVIFNTDAAIRFGGTSWDWNVWAGLKYTHSNKTIYLGIADNSIFNANSAQSGGSLRFPGISNVYATTFNGSLSGNASTATNADKVDGYHANGLLTALSNSNNGISITVGGTTKSISNISVNYANSAGSATKVIVNQHTTNDTNYPLVWSNQSNTNSVTENQLYKSWSDLYYNPKNKRLTVGGSVVASSFIKSGGTSQQLLRADGGIATFNWSGQSGQPTWLWGGNNQHSYYVYNPSNFRVAYATSAGSADTLDGVHLSGIFTAFGNNGHNITATIGGTTKSFLVNWAADSDKLDGYHASNLLTSVTNTNNGISVTVGGTTKSVSNISVNYASSAGSADTAQYLRSLGNQNCQTGRTQNYGDVYTYNTYANNTGAPTSYTSVIGFGRGIAGTVEIAGGWDNTNLYWRSLRDCCEDWHSWRTVLDSSNYTEFINNYYWANVKISTSSSTTTSPTVSNLTATSSIRMGNIYLQNTNEINSASGIHLNYQNSGNISLCAGGGNVGIGTISPAYKLDVNGQVRASGFRHSSVNSDNYVLLAGGGYKSFGGDSSHPVFLGYLNLDHGSNGTVSSSFYCLGYSVPFTYTRGGNYCKISIPDTTHQAFYIKAATASVNYSGGGMDTWTGNNRGAGAWWLHCYAPSSNEVRVKGFHQKDTNNDSWWGGNPLWSDRSGANRITVCIFGYVTFR